MNEINLKYWGEVLVRGSTLVGGMLLGCFIFAVIVTIVGTTEACDKEFLLAFIYTLLTIGAFILITVILLVKNQVSLEKLKRGV